MLKRIFFASLIALLFISALIYWYPSSIQPTEAVKKQIVSEHSHILNWKGGEIHFTDQGSGPTILMVHGFGGSHRNFRKLALELEKSFRVIRVDLPGFALSDMPDEYYQNKQYLNMYESFFGFMIDSVIKDSVILVGNSLGGGLSWYYTGLHPEKIKHLYLMGSAGFDMSEVSLNATGFLQSGAGDWLCKKGIPLWLSEKNADRCFCNPNCVDQREVQNNNMLWNRENNVRNAIDLVMNATFPDTMLLKNITQPVTIVWGKQDRIVPVAHAERFKSMIPHAEVILLDSCGHIPMIEKSEVVANLFRK